MGRKDKGSADKKRDGEEAAAAAAPKQKKAKQAAKAEEEEMPDLEVESADVEDFSEGDEGEEEEGEESDDGEPSAAQVWQEALHNKAEEKGAMVCLLGNLDGDNEDEGEESDDEEPTVEKLESMTRLFLPKKTEEYLEALGEALGDIGRSDPEDDEEDEEDEGGTAEDAAAMKAFKRLLGPRMLQTRHSHPMHALIKSVLKDVDKAIKSKKWEEAFCRWAGTLLAVQDEDHWFLDTDVPEEAKSIYKQLKKQWQTIKAHSLEDLGNPSCEGGSSPDVKAALEHMLGRLAKGMQAAGIEM